MSRFRIFRSGVSLDIHPETDAASRVMGSNDSHVVLSVQFLAEAEEAKVHLDDLGEDQANSWPARAARTDMGIALKMAEVHALLAIGELLARVAPRHDMPVVQ